MDDAEFCPAVETKWIERVRALLAGGVKIKPLSAAYMKAEQEYFIGACVGRGVILKQAPMMPVKWQMAFMRNHPIVELERFKA